MFDTNIEEAYLKKDKMLILSALDKAQLINTIVTKGNPNNIDDLFAVFRCLKLLGEILKPPKFEVDKNICISNDLLTHFKLKGNIFNIIRNNLVHKYRNVLDFDQFYILISPIAQDLFNDLKTSIPIVIERLKSAAIKLNIQDIQVNINKETLEQEIQIISQKNSKLNNDCAIDAYIEFKLIRIHLDILNGLSNYCSLRAGDQIDESIIKKIYALDHCLDVIGISIKHLNQIKEYQYIDYLISLTMDSSIQLKINTIRSDRNESAHNRGVKEIGVDESYRNTTIRFAVDYLLIEPCIRKYFLTCHSKENASQFSYYGVDDIIEHISIIKKGIGTIKYFCNKINEIGSNFPNLNKLNNIKDELEKSYDFYSTNRSIEFNLSIEELLGCIRYMEFSINKNYSQYCDTYGFKILCVVFQSKLAEFKKSKVELENLILQAEKDEYILAHKSQDQDMSDSYENPSLGKSLKRPRTDNDVHILNQTEVDNSEMQMDINKEFFKALQTAEEKITQLKVTVDSKEKERKALEESNETLDKSLKKSDFEKKALNEALDSKEKERKALEESNETLDKSLKKSDFEKKALNEALDSKEKERKALEESNETLDKSLKKSDFEKKALNEALDSKEKEIKTLKQCAENKPVNIENLKKFGSPIHSKESEKDEKSQKGEEPKKDKSNEVNCLITNNVVLDDAQNLSNQSPGSHGT